MCWFHPFQFQSSPIDILSFHLTSTLSYPLPLCHPEWTCCAGWHGNWIQCHQARIQLCTGTASSRVVANVLYNIFATLWASTAALALANVGIWLPTLYFFLSRMISRKRNCWWSPWGKCFFGKAWGGNKQQGIVWGFWKYPPLGLASYNIYSLSMSHFDKSSVTFVICCMQSIINSQQCFNNSNKCPHNNF